MIIIYKEFKINVDIKNRENSKYIQELLCKGQFSMIRINVFFNILLKVNLFYVFFRQKQRKWICMMEEIAVSQLFQLLFFSFPSLSQFGFYILHISNIKFAKGFALLWNEATYQLFLKSIIDKELVLNIYFNMNNIL